MGSGSALPHARGCRLVTLIISAGALLTEDEIRMARPLPHPRTVLGYRRDGRPVYPILGASDDDPSNTDPAKPAAGGPGPTVDQDTLSRLLAREKEQGARAGVKRLLEGLGFTKSEELTAWVKSQRDAEAAQLSVLEQREKAAADATAAAKQREDVAAARERSVLRRAALMGHGATGDGLTDAERLLDAPEDSDDRALNDAVAQLKARRPELFGSAAAAPPAPGGSPAGGPPARGGSTAKPGAAGLEMAKRRGFITA
jgi:hypothetical protein